MLVNGYLRCSMGIIKHILKEELERLEQLSLKYENEIAKLPKGSLSKKKRNKNIFVYLAYREKDKVKFKYLGKENSEAVLKIKEQIEQRQKYLDDLKKIKSDIKEIKRALNERR
jgi:hypothetical protein